MSVEDTIISIMAGTIEAKIITFVISSIFIGIGVLLLHNTLKSEEINFFIGTIGTILLALGALGDGLLLINFLIQLQQIFQLKLHP